MAIEWPVIKPIRWTVIRLTSAIRENKPALVILLSSLNGHRVILMIGGYAAALRRHARQTTIEATHHACVSSKLIHT